MKKIVWLIAFISIVIIPIISLYNFSSFSKCVEPEEFEVKIIQAFARNNQSFTQGFFLYNGLVYESFGQYGESGRKAYKLGEMNPVYTTPNSSQIFAEGMAVLDNKIVQISWMENKAFILNPNLELVGEFTYEGEGWGLTSNGKHFIMSNGTSEIAIREAKTFTVLKKLKVKKMDKEVDQLNELEYIDEEIWANIWQEDEIIAINPESGCVTKTIDASSLWMFEKSEKKYSGAVLNGIAYNEQLGHIYLTGKNWENIFQVELLKK